MINTEQITTNNKKPQAKSKNKKRKLNLAEAIAVNIIKNKENGKPAPQTVDELQETGIKRSSCNRILVAIKVVEFLEETGYFQKSKDATVNIDPSTLPATWKEKYDIALRKALKELQVKFDQAVSDRSKELINKHMLPGWKKKIDYAEKMEQSWRKDTYALSRQDYKKILICLHPDRVTDESLKSKYTEAFNIFKGKEDSLVMPEAPKDKTPPIPPSFDDIMRMKR